MSNPGNTITISMSAHAIALLCLHRIIVAESLRQGS